MSRPMDHTLTLNETRIHRILSQGLSLQEVADRTGMSLAGLHFVIEKLMRKTGSTSVQELTEYLPLWDIRSNHQNPKNEQLLFCAERQDPDLRFYRMLGPDQKGKECKKIGCGIPPIVNSIHCRVHHFESVKGHPCPFEGDA